MVIGKKTTPKTYQKKTIKIHIHTVHSLSVLDKLYELNILIILERPLYSCVLSDLTYECNNNKASEIGDAFKG